MKKLCEIERCQNEAKYALYKTFPNGGKRWLQVCAKHEKQIVWENLMKKEDKRTTKQLADLKAMRQASRIKGG